MRLHPDLFANCRLLLGKRCGYFGNFSSQPLRRDIFIQEVNMFHSTEVVRACNKAPQALRTTAFVRRCIAGRSVTDVLTCDKAVGSKSRINRYRRTSEFLTERKHWPFADSSPFSQALRRSATQTGMKIEIVRDDVVGGYTLRGHRPICGESLDSKGVYGRTSHDKVAADFAKHVEEKHRREYVKGTANK